MSHETNDLITLPTPGSPATAFLAALARRDLDGLARCLAPSAQMRALVPPGFRVFDGRDAIEQKFRAWFGADEDFELLDANATMVGPRPQLRWRVRLTPRNGESAVFLEQIAFLAVDAQVQAIDLICSGFLPDEMS